MQDSVSKVHNTCLPRVISLAQCTNTRVNHYRKHGYNCKQNKIDTN